jgi:hypothetical protein
MNNSSSDRGAMGAFANKPEGTSATNKGSSASIAGAGPQAAVRDAASKASEQATSLADTAKDVASKASEKLLDSVEEQKVAGADFVSGMAGALRRAANEFGEVPQAAQYIRLAASQIDNVSDAFRKRDLSQLLSDVQGFARRQPTAFLGIAALAGFAAVRFFKTSTAKSAANPPSSRKDHASASPSTPDYRTSSAAG